MSARIAQALFAVLHPAALAPIGAIAVAGLCRALPHPERLALGGTITLTTPSRR